MSVKNKRNVSIFLIACLQFLSLGALNLTAAKANAKPTLYNKCFMGSQLGTGIGKVKTNPRIAKLGSAGYLTTGPYIPLEAGTYKVQLSYSSQFSGSSVNVGFVDRASNFRTIQGSSVPLSPQKAGVSNISVKFTTSRLLPAFEFRVFANGKSELQVNSICITQTN